MHNLTVAIDILVTRITVAGIGVAVEFAGFAGGTRTSVKPKKESGVAFTFCGRRGPRDIKVHV